MYRILYLINNFKKQQDILVSFLEPGRRVTGSTRWREIRQAGSSRRRRESQWLQTGPRTATRAVGGGRSDVGNLLFYDFMSAPNIMIWRFLQWHFSVDRNNFTLNYQGGRKRKGGKEEEWRRQGRGEEEKRRRVKGRETKSEWGRMGGRKKLSFSWVQVSKKRCSMVAW